LRKTGKLAYPAPEPSGDERSPEIRMAGMISTLFLQKVSVNCDETGHTDEQDYRVLLPAYSQPLTAQESFSGVDWSNISLFTARC
jgi:hypothetical protein